MNQLKDLHTWEEVRELMDINEEADLLAEDDESTFSGFESGAEHAYDQQPKNADDDWFEE